MINTLISHFFYFLKDEKTMPIEIILKRYPELVDNDRTYFHDGDLDLELCNISKLPDHLTINGSLCIRYTTISELPKKLNVSGFIFCRGTPLYNKHFAKIKNGVHKKMIL